MNDAESIPIPAEDSSVIPMPAASAVGLDTLSFTPKTNTAQMRYTRRRTAPQVKSHAVDEKMTIEVGVGETSIASSVPMTCSARTFSAKEYSAVEKYI